MLKQRVITALWLIPLAIGGLFYAEGFLFHAFIVAIMLLASWEWALLAGIKSQFKRVLYAVVVGIVFVFNAIYSIAFDMGYFRVFATNFVITSAFWWLFAFFLVIKYPIYFKQWALLLIGVLILLPCAYGLIMVAQFKFLLFILIGVVCLADIGAYFVGKKFGKHKLAVKISPGKTIEGVIGGFGASFIFVVACYVWLVFGTNFVHIAQINDGISHALNLFFLGAFSLVLTLSSVLGDLTESLFKRLAGVKDSSNLLPGHGGVLDRIDGFTCAAPIFYLVLIIGQNTSLVQYFMIYGF